MMVRETAAEVMTAKEAAAYLRVSLNWLYLQVLKKIVPASRIGKLWRFRKSDLDAWMARGLTVPRE